MDFERQHPDDRFTLRSLGSTLILVGNRPPSAAGMKWLERELLAFGAKHPGRATYLHYAFDGGEMGMPDDETRAMVACTGHSGAFDPAEVRASAGVVVVQLDGDQLVEEARWEAATDALSAVAVNGIVALSADEFVAAEYGDFVAPTNDKAYRVVISTGAQTEIAEAEGQYMIGTSAFDPASGLLLVPDASEGLRRFAVTETTTTEGTVVALTTPRGLPPRHVAIVAR